jgi:glycogen operon protein
VPIFVDRLSASASIFNHQGRRPCASVNFITAHDGFTLQDVVSYNEKHNEANGEQNADGTMDNRSWNCGAEGPSDDPGILSLRHRQQRNMLATLLLSQGTPMMLGGDEFGRTQWGNNNAYCQDTEISWYDWNVGEAGSALIKFVQNLTTLRHKYPILRRNLFFNGQHVEELGVRDVTWIHTTGLPREEQHWGDPSLRCFGMLLDGRAQSSGIRQRGKEATLLIIFNAHHEGVNFILPECEGGREWSRLVDTNVPENHDKSTFKVGSSYVVTGRSLVLYVLLVDS